MPAHKRPDRHLKLVRDIIHDCLREGYAPPDLPVKGKSAHTETVARLEELGHNPNTAWTWISAIQSTQWKPDYGLYRPFQYQAVREGKRILPAYRPADVLKPDRPAVRMGVIGDAHDSPHDPDKSRFEWMGRWVADQKFDHVIQLGDFATMDSMTRHAAPGTKSFGDLPSFQEDLASVCEALDAFDRGLQGHKCRKEITWGNHEHRADKYEDNNPQMFGIVGNTLRHAFTSRGWRVIPFGEIHFVEGVGFTHHPMNAMGRPYGGKTANSRAGNDLLFSLIHGHDHKREVASCAKIGPQGFIETISAGCSLPWGTVEDYAKHGPSGWWWGVMDVRIAQGQILDQSFTSMLTLEEKYSSAKKRAK